MSDDASWLAALSALVLASGIDLPAAILGAFRVFPLVVLVPAFGLRAVPAAVRLTLAFTLGVACLPATRPLGGDAWLNRALLELARGLPVAIVSASGLWIATMAGGLADELRAGRERSNLAVLEGETSPLGALFGMLAAVAFLISGGPARAAIALADAPALTSGSLAHVAHALSSGISLAVAIAGPLLVVAVVAELGAALVARAASPAFIQPLWAPLRSFLILVALALVFDRLSALLALAAQGRT